MLKKEKFVLFDNVPELMISTQMTIWGRVHMSDVFDRTVVNDRVESQQQQHQVKMMAMSKVNLDSTISSRRQQEIH